MTWKYEPERHALASKGIRTKINPNFSISHGVRRNIRTELNDWLESIRSEDCGEFIKDTRFIIFYNDGNYLRLDCYSDIPDDIQKINIRNIVMLTPYVYTDFTGEDIEFEDESSYINKQIELQDKLRKGYLEPVSGGDYYFERYMRKSTFGKGVYLGDGYRRVDKVTGEIIDKDLKGDSFYYLMEVKKLRGMK